MIDGQMDGLDGQTDRQTDGWYDFNLPPEVASGGGGGGGGGALK